MNLYIAINKETGNVMSGANGQYAYADPGTLKRSIGQAYGYAAGKKGVKPRDLYDIISVDVEELKKIGVKYE